MMKKLWIVTELFYPKETATAYILTEYAKVLRAKYKVNVICASEKNEDKKNIEGVNIYRIIAPDLNKDKLIQRVLRFVFVSFMLGMTVLFKCKRQDKVLIATNPAPMLLFIVLIKQIKRFNLSILVHDVFPENAIAAKIYKNDHSLQYKILKRWFDWSYSKANQLIVLGRDMKDVMINKIGKNFERIDVSIVENWAEQGIIRNFDNVKCENEDCIVIQYAGNIGRVQGLFEFVDIFSRVDNPFVKFEIWGYGALEYELRKYVKENNIHNVIFCGKYTRGEQNEVLHRCDISLVSLSSKMYGLGVPSKSYNIMAASNPILYIGDIRSEIALTIKENDIGYCFDNSDEEGIFNFLSNIKVSDRKKLDLMRERVLKASEKYSHEAISMKILDTV